MLKNLNMRTLFVAFGALLITSLPAHAGGKHRHDKDDDSGRWLYGIRGSTRAVNVFVALYKDRYEQGYPLRVACDFPIAVDPQNILFVCDPDGSNPITEITPIYNAVLSVYPGEAEMGITAASQCPNMHCNFDRTTGCSSYKGPYCTIPGCYHTNYYCVGTHTCVPN